MKWEYKSVVQTNHHLMDRDINKFGKLGWRVKKVIDSQNILMERRLRKKSKREN
jgi:hypothetical protein